MRNTHLGAVFVGTFLLLLVLMMPVSAQSEAVITLSRLTLTSGEEGIIEARLNCIERRCGALDITLRFDPGVIQISQVDLGTYLGDVEQAQVFIANNTVDNVSGVLHLAAVSMGMPAEAENDLLFIVHVMALYPGSTELRASELVVGDMHASPMESSITGGTIIVLDPHVAFPISPVLLSPTATAGADSTEEPVNCTVVASREDTPIHVGPGEDRAVRGVLRANTNTPVTGQAQADDGSKWWRPQMGEVAAEFDRYWVRQDIVTTQGDCDSVELVDASAVIPIGIVQSTPVGGLQGSRITCNPGQWDGNCGSNACPADHVSRCNNEGTGWECVWHPQQCVRTGPSLFVCDQSFLDALDAYYHQTVPPAPAYLDLNGDGYLNVADLGICGRCRGDAAANNPICFR